MTKHECPRHGLQPYVNGTRCQACAYEAVTGHQLAETRDPETRRKLLVVAR